MENTDCDFGISGRYYMLNTNFEGNLIGVECIQQGEGGMFRAL